MKYFWFEKIFTIQHLNLKALLYFHGKTMNKTYLKVTQIENFRMKFICNLS